MLKSKVNRTKKLQEYYDKYLVEKLNVKAKEIVSHLEEYFSKYELEYKLVFENSVYDDLKLYDFTYRIKQSKSLFSKLIDKDYEIEFTEEELLAENDKVNDFFLEMKDLIGIKIITNLYSDCSQVMKLLRKTGNDINIKIDMTGEIPTNMKNGLSIFKMQGSHEEYNFELQIKSKLDSTWGDLEHILFYKDYEFYHIKKNNKIIMNKIGLLIRDLEDMMLSIRNAKTQFNLDYDLMTFNKKINSFFETEIKKEVGNTKILEDYMNLFYSLYIMTENQNYKIDIKTPVKKIEYTPDTESVLIIQYRNAKENSIKLIVLEYIYLNWFTQNDIEKNYSIILENYLRNLLTINFEQVSKRLNREILIEEEVEKIITNIILFKGFFINKKIFLSPDLLEEYYLITSSTNEYISQVENSEEEIFTFELDEIGSDTVEKEIEKTLFNLLLLKPEKISLSDGLGEYDYILILTESLNIAEKLIDSIISEDKFKEDYYFNLKNHLRKSLGGIINEKLCD